MATTLAEIYKQFLAECVALSQLGLTPCVPIAMNLPPLPPMTAFKARWTALP